MNRCTVPCSKSAVEYLKSKNTNSCKFFIFINKKDLEYTDQDSKDELLLKHKQRFIDENVEIGENCILYPGTKIYRDTQIGDFCTLHANVVIGSDGFGFAPQEDGTYKKVPQIGKVIIEDRVDFLLDVNEGGDADFTTLFEQLEFYFDHPINLNRANKLELEDFKKVLRVFQISIRPHILLQSVRNVALQQQLIRQKYFWKTRLHNSG